MKYFVIAPDGNKYGPADAATLAQWVAEGRLSHATMLEEEGSGARLPATSIPGLFGGMPTATATPQAPNMGAPGASPYSEVPYPRGPGYYNPQGGYDNGQSDLNLSWIFFALGVCVCSPVFCPLGIWKANEAMKKGNPNANVAKILNIIWTILGVLGTIYYIVLIATGGLNALVRPPT